MTTDWNPAEHEAYMAEQVRTLGVGAFAVGTHDAVETILVDRLDMLGKAVESAMRENPRWLRVVPLRATAKQRAAAGVEASA
jgi:hypothetical protein